MLLSFPASRLLALFDAIARLLVDAIVAAAVAPLGRGTPPRLDRIDDDADDEAAVGFSLDDPR